MLDFRVVPDVGEPYEVTATARDVLHWERTHKGVAFQDIMNRLRMEDLYYLAWRSSQRLGLTELTLRDFETSVDVEQKESDESESDPTQSGVSGEPS